MRIAQVKEMCTSGLPAMPGVRQELLEVCQAVPFPVWPGKAKNAQHIGSIPVLNAMFRHLLNDRGWQVEKRLHTGNVVDAYKVFDGLRVMVEVQMANGSRLDSDLVKYMVCVDESAADLCVSLVLDRKTAELCASGVAYFEAFDSRTSQLKRLSGIPILGIGLSQESAPRVDVGSMGISPQDIEQGRSAKLCDDLAALVLKDQLSRPTQIVLPPRVEQTSLF